MKQYLLVLFSILFFFFSLRKTQAQQIVSNGATTTAINFPAGTCTYTWTNNNTSIGLAASGTGNIPSFKAVNTGSSPVTATITGTPVSTGGFAYIVNAGSNNVSVINTATDAVVATIPVGSNPNGVCVDPNYNEVYVVNNGSNTVSVISTLTNTVTATIPVGPTPWSVTVSQDGSKAYVADGGDNEVEVINTTTNAVVATIPAGTNPNASVVSPNGSLIYVNSNNSVLVINTSTNALIATIPVGSAPQAILVTPDGSKVYSADYASNTVSVINTATNAVIATIPVGSEPGGGSMSPDGSLVYIANESSNSVSVISTTTNTVVKTIAVGASPWGVSVRPDGTQIYVANSGSNTISVVNASTNAIIATIPVGSLPYSFGSFFTAGANCTELVKYTITVNPTSAAPPTITASAVTGSISACAGIASASPQIEQFTVSGSGLTGGITATAPAGFEVSLLAGSGYGGSVTIPESSGTVDSATVYVRSAAGAQTGSISGNVTLTSIGAGTQTVAVSASVNPNVMPSIVISASENNICAGTPVTFTANPTNGGSSPVYQWLLNGNDTGTNSPTFSSSTLLNGDVISCRLTSNATCLTISDTTSNVITMIVNTPPSPPGFVNAALSTCSGSSATISIANPQDGFTYNWYADAGGATLLFTGTDFTTPALTSTTTYYAGAVNSTGCVSALAAATVTVTPLPDVTSQDVAVCPDSTATLTATSTDNNATINWYSSATGGTSLATGTTYAVTGVTAATTYYAEADDNTTGCVSATRAAVNITITQPLATAVVSTEGTTTNSVTFQWAAVTGATDYQVSIDSGKTFTNPSSGADGLTNTVTGLQEGQKVTLIVEAIGSLPCQTSVSAPFTATANNYPADLIYVPNAFTPNGDGHNDQVHVHGQSISSLKFYIYDEWGELVFSSTNIQDGWDGTYKGTKERVGVYVYYLQAVMNDGKTVNKKGTITLIR